MSVKLTSIGTGTFYDGASTDNVIDYSVSIDASPLLLGDYTGGSSSISATARANTSASILNSQTMIDNLVTITDTDRGSFSGNVKSITFNSNDTVSISGDSLINYLDIDVSMKPVGGNYKASDPMPRTTYAGGYPAYTLKNAIDYYLYSVTSTLGVSVNYSNLTSTQTVNIPAWSGNLLAHIKEMCAIYRMRFWATENTYYFADISENIIDASGIDVSITSTSNANGKTINITNNNTTYIGAGSNAAVLFKATETYTVNEEYDTTTKRLNTFIETPNMDIVTVRSVVIASGTDMFTYMNETVPTTSVIGLLDADGYEISDAAWTAAGGSASIVEWASGGAYLCITPPKIGSAGRNNIPGPYTIGFNDYDEAGNEAVVPAIVLVGSGLSKSSTITNVALGTISAQDVAAEIVSPFIYDNITLANATYYASSYYGKNDISATTSAPLTSQQFTNIDNIRFIKNFNKYKVSSATVTYDSVQINAEPATTIMDLDLIWSNKSIAQLDAIIGKFTIGDWSAIPLVS